MRNERIFKLSLQVLMGSACALILAVVIPGTAHASTIRDARRASGLYGTESFTTNSTQAAPAKSPGFWEAVSELVTGIKSEATRLKDGRLTRDDGNYQQTVGNPAIESETVQYTRNAIAAAKEAGSYSVPTGMGDALSGLAVDKADEAINDPKNVAKINDATRNNPFTNTTDRGIRRLTSGALKEQGFDQGTIDAYIDGGQEKMDAYFQSHKSAQDAYRRANTSYEDAKKQAEFARYKDACRHGRYDEANAIKNGKYGDYIRNKAAKNNVQGNTGVASGVSIEKPNIYLYPEKRTEIRVTFADPEKLTATIPEYDVGWEVVADVDGILTNLSDGLEYTYLFYEADVRDELFETEKGFAVPAEKREAVYERVLTAYGLNQQEIADFIEYWSDRLEEGVDYMMYPQAEALVDRLMPMEIAPAPDHLLRLWFVFEEATGNDLEDTMELTEIPPADRSGYYGIEWGGAVR